MKTIDITGQRFGRLLVIEKTERPQYVAGTDAWFKCICDCGKTCVIRGKSMRSGITTSCGCYKTETLKMRRGKNKGGNKND